MSSHDYALGFGSRMVVVSVNPRDVVSVPLGESSKIRVCRYSVLLEIDREAIARATTGIDSSPALWRADEKIVKKLKRAKKSQKLVEVTYHGKTYAARVLKLTDTLVKVQLDNDSYRQFHLDSVARVRKLTPQSLLTQKFQRAMDEHGTLKVKLNGSTRAITVKPRRFIDENTVGVTVVQKKNPFRKLKLSEISSAE